MFWLIIGIIALIISGIDLKRSFKPDKKEWNLSIVGSTALIVSGLCLLIISLQVFGGAWHFSNLSKQLSQVRILQIRVVEMRSATYPHSDSGKLFSGSIENLKQSTNLSEYIRKLADREAQYNGKLTELRVSKENFVLWFFAGGWALPNEIYDLPLIK